jgi:sugar diacid utilization regulator
MSPRPKGQAGEEQTVASTLRAPRTTADLSRAEDLDLDLLSEGQPPPVSNELRLMAERASADPGRYVGTILAMSRSLPEFRDIRDVSFWNEVEQIVRLNVPLFHRAMLDDWSPTEEEVAANRAFARCCVERQITLRSYLAAYREGMWILWGHLVNEVAGGRPALRRELLLRTVWVLRNFEMIAGTLSQAYYAELEGQARHRDAALRELFDEIIDGSPAPSDELQTRASALSVDLDASYHTVVMQARLGKGHPMVAALTGMVARSAGLAAGDIVFVDRGRETVFFSPIRAAGATEDAFRSSLAAALSARSSDWPKLRAGVSGAVQGADGIRRGYREARRSLEIGATYEPDTMVWFYPELALEDLFQSNRIASARLVHESLARLLADGAARERHIETLAAYFREGLCLKQAAASLGIHPNSLLYRMRRIRQIAGIDPTAADHRLGVEIALRLLARDRALCTPHKIRVPDS